jgi:hypothetical protein
MSVSVHYWAVPPSSILFARLQSDRTFVTLMATLFHYGRGIYFFFDDLSSAEREQILEWVIEHKLRRDPEAGRSIDEFQLELERTRLTYAGVEHRRWSLEKTSFLVEERLSEALDAEFVRTLMFGDQVLGPVGALDVEDTLSLISPPLVQEGVQLLSEVDVVDLFINDLDWQFDSFQHWLWLYQDAAAKSEALLVGVC